MFAHHLCHDYLEFIVIIIIMITSTGREESAQLCVYVGGEKVVTFLPSQFYQLFVLCWDFAKAVIHFPGDRPVGQQEPLLHRRHPHQHLLQV